MKLKSPLTDKKEVEPLCEAGADELFCGIEPYVWRKRYKDFSINQRSRGANFAKLSDLEKAIQISHRYRVKVHVTANAFFYLEEQYKMLKKIIRDILNVGADGLIFAEPTLLLNGDNKRLLNSKDVVIGCDAVILNSAAVRLYKKLGATRVVLPRAMTIQEIEELIKSDHSMEYEVFIIHDLCFFEDGLCTYCKEATGGIKKEGRGRKNIYLFSASRIPLRGLGGGCRTNFKRQRISMSNKKIGKIRPFTFWTKKHIEGCGACAIYDLKRIGVTSLKVLDRNLPSEEKVKATRFIKKCLDLLRNNNLSKDDYIKYCKERFRETFKVRCDKFDCYYPSVFLSN